MSYEIYLSYNNRAEEMQLPVNPESIDVTNKGNGKTYDIIGHGGSTHETRAGEVNVIKNPSLKEVTFSSLFPATVYPFVIVKKLYEPMHYIRTIERWMSTKHPIRFSFAGRYSEQLQRQGFADIHDLNFPASIEKFDWKEAAGSPGDIEYTIGLKEYVFYSARQLKVKKDDNGEPAIWVLPTVRPDERIRPDHYVLLENETLLDVAMKFFDQDSERSRDIQKLNGLTDRQARNLKKGDYLKIPPY
ncbi:peptidoglycan-binding protein LysM [Paenibacillus alba]|uniref:peptidoglycan-binding protein LysM n=1 Tax=Paenibacillus alba TaxID=1197127 RepID=UPI0015659AE9|nr:peptidoglycan-binding protein LysM [Paenibacillus alba]NQX68068.1 peptidoglycan-binding protein LysM [Paenibacillus alba]